MVDCRELAQEIFERAKELSLKFGIKERKVVIINASDDIVSKKYVELKEKKFNELGIVSQVKHLKTFKEVQDAILEANKDRSVVGVMVQLPLYPELEKDRTEILHLIDPTKDIDGLSGVNLSNIGTEKELILPATVEGIVILLERIAKIDSTQTLTEYLKGKRVVIVNDSKLIGYPLTKKLKALGAQVDMLNKYTEDVKGYTIKAEIVVTATGNDEIFNSTFFKDDSILIDVTSIKTDEGTKGDIKVDENLKPKVKFVTPVPGGVGPLTVSSLMLNTIKLAILQT